MPYEEDDVENQQQDDSSPLSIKDYIAQRLDQNKDDLKAAQQKSMEQKGLSGIAQGLGQSIVGLSRGESSNFDPKSYDFLNQNAELPVNNMLQLQKSQGQELTQAAEQQNIEQKNDSLNPNSTRSKVVNAIMGKFAKPGQLDGLELSAADAPLVEKLLTNQETAESRKETARQNNLFHKQITEQKYDDDFSKNTTGGKGYTTADQASKGANDLIQQANLALTNKTATAQLPTLIALAVSHGQRMHGQTIDASNKIGSWMDQIKVALSKNGTGVLPPEIVKDIVTFASSVKSASESQKNDIFKFQAEQFKANHGRYPKAYDPFSSQQQPAPASIDAQAPAGSDPLTQEMSKRGLLK